MSVAFFCFLAVGCRFVWRVCNCDRRDTSCRTLATAGYQLAKLAVTIINLSACTIALYGFAVGYFCQRALLPDDLWVPTTDL